MELLTTAFVIVLLVMFVSGIAALIDQSRADNRLADIDFDEGTEFDQYPLPAASDSEELHRAQLRAQLGIKEN